MAKKFFFTFSRFTASNRSRKQNKPGITIYFDRIKLDCSIKKLYPVINKQEPITMLHQQIQSKRLKISFILIGMLFFPLYSCSGFVSGIQEGWDGTKSDSTFFNQPYQPTQNASNETRSLYVAPIISYTTESSTPANRNRQQQKKKEYSQHNTSGASKVSPEQQKEKHKTSPEPRLNGDKFTIPGL